jgi:hypothetical protein
MRINRLTLSMRNQCNRCADRFPTPVGKSNAALRGEARNSREAVGQAAEGALGDFD